MDNGKVQAAMCVICVGGVSVHLWYLSSSLVKTLFVGQHKRIPVCVCVLLEGGFRLQLLSAGTQSALQALIIVD